MKKLQTTTPSTRCACQHRSINKMLTPFLFVFFLLGVLNVGVAQTCPPPKAGCEVTERTSVFDIGTLFGKPGCEIEFSYKERLCLDNNIDVFDVETNPSNWTWTSQACIDAYNKHVKTIVSQGTIAINDLILKQEILLSEAALQFSATLHLTQNPHLVCPNSFVSGRSFFKTCSVSCMRLVEKPFGLENPKTVFFMDIVKIPCGTTCCIATQKFCKNATTNIAEPIGPKTFTSNNISGCDKSTTVKGCEAKWGYFGKTSCIIACDFVPKALTNGGSSEDDIANIDINAKSIKASITNNSTTNTIVVSFMSDFVGKISLFDISGRQVFSADANTNNGGFFYIETDKFNSGVYLLSLQDNSNNIITEKILIK